MKIAIAKATGKVIEGYKFRKSNNRDTKEVRIMQGTPHALRSHAETLIAIGKHGGHEMDGIIGASILDAVNSRRALADSVTSARTRLNAAAPDLLDALKEAQVRLFMVDGSSPLYVRIGSLINRAEGRE